MTPSGRDASKPTGNALPRSPSRRTLALALPCALAAPSLLLRPAPARGADLPALIAASKPAVVAVGVHAPLQAPRFRFHGSGFAVGNGRQVATCAHVLPTIDPAANESLAVAVPGADAAAIVRARIALLDRDADLAVLDIEGPALPALALGEPAQVREGVDVVLIGFPLGGALGLFAASHRGLIAAITPMIVPAARSAGLRAQNVQVMRGAPIQLLQLDLISFPGNSGGPLIDAASGRVLGVANLGFAKGTRESAIENPSGISYAIPVRYLAALLGTR